MYSVEVIGLGRQSTALKWEITEWRNFSLPFYLVEQVVLQVSARSSISHHLVDLPLLCVMISTHYGTYPLLKLLNWTMPTYCIYQIVW